MLVPFKTYTIKSLESHSQKIFHPSPEVISRYPIACVDDNKFDEIPRLVMRGYNIKHHHDISRIEDIKQYRIILCDIHGVGIYWDPAGSGVNLMKAIAADYPDKYIIGYSGLDGNNAENRALIEKAETYADKYVVKSPNLPVERWVEYLNTSISIISNPHDNWLRVKKRLRLLPNFDKHAVELEDNYVRYILSKNDKYKIRSSEILSFISIAADSKEIFGDLLSGLLYA